MSVTTITREYDSEGRVVKEVTVTQGDTSTFPAVKPATYGCGCTPPATWMSIIPWTCIHRSGITSGFITTTGTGTKYQTWN